MKGVKISNKLLCPTDFFEFVELNTHEIIAGPFSIWKEKKLDLIGCVDMLEVI